MRSIRLVTAKLADACVEGQARRREYVSGKQGKEEDFVAAPSTGTGPAVEYAARRGRGGGRPGGGGGPRRGRGGEGGESGRG
jgi:small subunit ribosomal protein S2